MMLTLIQLHYETSSESEPAVWLAVLLGANDDCAFEGGIAHDDDDHEGSNIDGERDYDAEDYSIDTIHNKR